LNRIELIKNIKGASELDDLGKIKSRIERLLKEIGKQESKLLFFTLNDELTEINGEYLIGELNQILKTKTIERTKYYINRLVKSLTKNKTSKINDLNLNRWKEYEDIITDSLWVLEKRDKSGAHKADYWGNFIPQIPNQFIRRYTKKDDWVLDAFAGSGTTLIECKRLSRNGIGIELNADVVKLAKITIIQTIKKATNILN